MAGVTTTTLTNVIKTMYAKGLGAPLYDDCPFFGMVPKKAIFVGKTMEQPVQYSGNAAVGNTFGSVQTAAASSSNQYGNFSLTRKKTYAVGTIDREALWASKGDPGSFVRNIKSELDGSLYTMKKRLAAYAYGNGGAALGVVSASATVASTTLLLSNPNDVINWERGMILRASANDGTSGALRTGTVTITGVNRDSLTSGSLTAAANFSTGISAIAAGDYLFNNDDFGNAFTGLAGWVPSSAPSSTAFMGQDRTVDTRLGGLRFTGTGMPITEVLLNMATLVAREGGKITHFFMHPVQMLNLQLALDSKAVYISGKSSDATVGYDGIKVATPFGWVEVYADPYCPSNRIYGLKMDTWCLYSLGEVPHFVEDDGNQILRMTSEDSFEWRIAFMGQLGCSAPSYNIVATVSAT